jgi:hypothetical protein
MNVTSYITKEYENKSNWAICENEPNSNPNKPNFILSLTAFQVGQKKTCPLHGCCYILRGFEEDI